jgi:hypothetical protein
MLSRLLRYSTRTFIRSSPLVLQSTADLKPSVSTRGVAEYTEAFLYRRWLLIVQEQAYFLCSWFGTQSQFRSDESYVCFSLYNPRFHVSYAATRMDSTSWRGHNPLIGCFTTHVTTFAILYSCSVCRSGMSDSKPQTIHAVAQCEPHYKNMYIFFHYTDTGMSLSMYSLPGSCSLQLVAVER